MHVLISIKNVGKNFSPNWGRLDQMTEIAKNLFTEQPVTFQIEFTVAKTYHADHLLREVKVKGPVEVSLSPMANPFNSKMINPDFERWAIAVAAALRVFLDSSNPEGDILVAPQVSIYTGLSGSLKFLGDHPVSSF